MWELFIEFLTTLYLGIILGVIKGWSERVYFGVLLVAAVAASAILVVRGSGDVASAMEPAGFVASVLGWVIGTPMGELSYKIHVGGGR